MRRSLIPKSVVVRCPLILESVKWRSLLASLTLSFLALCGCSAGMAIDRPSDDDASSRLFDELVATIRQSDRVAKVQFEKPCFKCRTASLTVRDLKSEMRLVPLSDQRAAVIKNVLRDRQSFIFGIAKSCPSIVATRGFAFIRGDDLKVFLIYPDCKTARLIGEQPATPYVFNIDPRYENLLRLAE